MRSVRVVVAVVLAAAAWPAPARAEPVPENAAALLGAAYRSYDAGDFAAARVPLARLDDKRLVNRDYALWLRGMVELRLGNADHAAAHFRALAKLGSARFAASVPWRLADCAWLRGDRAGAAAQYGKLVTAAHADDAGDVGTALYRIAEAKPTAAAYRAMIVAHPEHPFADAAEGKMLALGGAPLTPAERIARAKVLTDVHLWEEAVAEIGRIGSGAAVPADVANQRDYWLGITLFKMRRRYGDAGDLLLRVAPKLDEATAAEAMFHGARALSRADRDDEAIGWYKQVVAKYPSTAFAKEAAYLAGWLQFNRGHYRDAIAPLEDALARYPGSKFADDTLWFLALSHYFLGEWDAARQKLTKLAARRGALEGGKGEYWLARIADKLGDRDAATAGYTRTVTAYPFSWYALLARARLAAAGTPIPPFGVADAHARGPKLAATVDEALASDELIERADELLAAGLGPDAGRELEAGEKPFLARHEHGAAFAMLLDRYRRAGDYFRPWMLAVSYCGTALDGPAEGDAQRWWENAYPRAYRELVDEYGKLGDNPDGYLYSIMRKESGFNPHDISYADAQGLLQMIPPTSRRVAAALGIPYDDGKLYEPAYNIEVGSWYIGHLLHKFQMQIPLGAGSFNSGPRPVMKWIDTNGDREIDELVELVPYTQTREYMKKVTENYARYKYLYAHEIYEQPLAVDKHYADDQLTY
jgi:soluble lytic murein transglycosylase